MWDLSFPTRNGTGVLCLGGTKSFLKINKYLFFWLFQVLVVARGIFGLCHGTWNLLFVPCKLLVVACGGLSRSLTKDGTQAACIGNSES